MNPDVRQLCDRLSRISYENLTKILSLKKHGDASKALRLADEFDSDADALLGGGTCYSMTWWLYVKFQELGYNPTLLIGHKGPIKNAHCALRMCDPPCHTVDSSGDFSEAHAQTAASVSGTVVGQFVGTSGPAMGQFVGASGSAQEFFLDPGYLIFDPLQMPGPGQVRTFDLLPNRVRLEQNAQILRLFTASSGDFKLRYEFPLQPVSEQEFRTHWEASFRAEMMKYPVLNRVDRSQGIQYYYQKDHLMIRDARGSRRFEIAPETRVQTLHEVFGIAPKVIADALRVLDANNKKQEGWNRTENLDLKNPFRGTL